MINKDDKSVNEVTQFRDTLAEGFKEIQMKFVTWDEKTKEPTISRPQEFMIEIAQMLNRMGEAADSLEDGYLDLLVYLAAVWNKYVTDEDEEGKFFAVTQADCDQGGYGAFKSAPDKDDPSVRKVRYLTAEEAQVWLDEAAKSEEELRASQKKTAAAKEETRAKLRKKRKLESKKRFKA